MFRSSNRAFKPSVYETGRRRKRGMPRWLVILFTGVIIGAGGYWFLQTNYGATRITVEESHQLNQQIIQLNQEQYAYRPVAKSSAKTYNKPKLKTVVY